MCSAVSVAHGVGVLATSQVRDEIVTRLLGENVRLPVYHALIVGISDYVHWSKVPWARADAEKLAQVLSSKYGFSDTRLLLDQEATRERILEELERLVGEMRENDAVLIYFAGQSFFFSSAQEAYWIPHDGVAFAPRAQADQKWLRLYEVRGYLSRLKARHVLLLNDSSCSEWMIHDWHGGRNAGEESRYRQALGQRSRWCIASGYRDALPSESRFGNRLLQVLDGIPQPVFSASDLAGWIKDGGVEFQGARMVYGPVRAANGNEGSDFVFVEMGGKSLAPKDALPSMASKKEEVLAAHEARPVRQEVMITPPTLPDQPAAAASGGDIKKAPAKNEPKVNVPALESEAQRLFARNDLDGAALLYGQILKAEPRHLTALSNLGVVLFQKGNLMDAEVMFRTVLETEPRDLFSLSMLGRVLSKQERAKEAVDVLGRALAIEPSNTSCYNYLGIAYGQSGEYALAERALLKALQLNKDFGEAHYNLALLYATQKPPFLELARKHYRIARRLHVPEDPELESLLSLVK